MAEMIQQLNQEQEDNSNGRKLSMLKREAKEELKKKVQDKAKKKIKELTKKAVMKAAKGGSAATLVGVIITYAIMTIQFIFGNIFKSKAIPKLGFAETIIWACATFFIIVAVVLIIFIIILLAMGFYVTLFPVAAAAMFGSEILEFIGF